MVWYEAGQKMTEGMFENGKPDGVWTTFDRNGIVLTKGSYKEGIQIGKWTIYDRDQNIYYDIFFS